MSARDEILERVRRGVGKGDFAGRRAAAERYMAERKLGPQPMVSGDLTTRFREKAESLASTVAAVGDLSSAAAEAARYLQENGLPNAAVIAPELANIAWAEAGLTVAARSAVDADAVGITSCFCAVAETGTLMLLSGVATPATVSLLPETHIALVPTHRIVATMEHAFALLRAEHGELPRAVNFISGPSRTGDIEQTIVLGDLILHEVLRGFRHDKLFEQARRLLGNLPCETLVGEQNAVAAAHHYRTLRALGHTVHKSNDVLIATWCIAEGVPLLAADRDFEPFARHLGLQLL